MEPNTNPTTPETPAAPTRVVITKKLLTDIGDAIRAANGTTEPMTIDEMITAIQAM